MIKGRNHLAEISGLTRPQVEEVIANCLSLYREKDEVQDDGSIRPIKYQIGNARKLNKAIEKLSKDKYQRPESVHGYVKKRSNVTHVNSHRGQKHFLVTDIKSFYPSISGEMIFGLLRACGMRGRIITDVIRVCMLAESYDVPYKKWHLPQGFCTSPVFSNMIFRKIDLKLEKFCDFNGIKYTRYADDMIFSSKDDFKNITSDIVGIIRSFGFKIKRKKTNYSIGEYITAGLYCNSVKTYPISSKSDIIDIAIKESPNSARALSLVAYRNNVINS